MKNKVILVDCDGVLFDWEYAFDQWMARHKYEVVIQNEYSVDKKYGLEKLESKRLVRMFNESANIRKLPPLRDAIKYVKKLHEDHGFIFHAITSLSNDQYAQHLRTKNLREMFGDTVFEKYVYLDCGADKDEVLKEYQGTGCFWVEDKPENYDAGEKVGLSPILMAHAHNRESIMTHRRVNSWKEIYDIIVG